MGEPQATDRRFPPSLAGRRVLVIGLGRFGGGVGVTRWLVSQGARVTVTDCADAEHLVDSVDAVADLDVTLHLGGHDLADLDATELAVVNPAVVKDRSALFKAIVRRKIDWTTEINLFCERCPAAVIGVTGSYGKSTTCAMLADALRAGGGAGQAAYGTVHLGGNIGRSLLTELPNIHPNDLVVLEMSNAQLDDLPRISWVPPIAVITNVAPHHLDRYETFEAYVDAKLNIARACGRPHTTIVGHLSPEADARLAGMARDHGTQVIRVPGFGVPINLRVPGDHNQANAAIVLAVSRRLGLSDALVRRALASFAGLPHRLEHIRRLDGVDYYNDSKATSPTASLAAIKAMDRPVLAIVGGQRRQGPLTDWAREVTQACRLVICVGESGPTFAEALRAVCDGGSSADVREAADLGGAVEAAHRAAQSGDAVLFSPGAPSFDRYANFAQRGEHFVSLVDRLGRAGRAD